MTDEQLMLAFQAGDARAFEALVRRHRAPVFQFILRFTGNKQKAEDLLQETWLRVVRGAAEYEAKARFTTWVYTLARNLCVDGARKDSYRQTDSLDAPARSTESDGPALGELVPDRGSASPERGAHNAELRPLLLQALAALPQEQREVFILREYNGIPFKEIAQVTQTPENTVKSRMRYAIEGLKRRLQELGVEADPIEDGRTVA